MTPVSLSKITPPQLTNTLPRPRLLNLLKKHGDRKLILILGQAAQGKSTLAASFLEQASAPSAWVNLGPEESDPVNLFHVIIQSLQRGLKGKDLSSLREYPLRTMGPRDPVGFYREWIRGLAGFISVPVFLTLDGLDRLVPDSPAFSFLQVLLEESPPDLRLVLSSRQTPPAAFNYQQLKMRQQALVLNNEDLAFTRTEIRAFFSLTRKITLKAEPLDKIRQATEGWVGGLILMAEILGRDLADVPELFLRDGFLSRFRVEAFEYLGREIFAAQPPEVQDMLIRASLVPLVDPSLMRGLSGGLETEQVLREFARRNLFVQGIYEPEKGWVFRFHQLFREFLLNRFQETFSQEERTALYRKAAGFYEERGGMESAVNLYIQAKDFARAAGIIKQIGMDLFDHGRTEDLSKILGALPEELIQEDPWLLLLFSLTRRWSEMPQNANRLERCLSKFEESNNARGAILSLSHLLEARFFTGLSWRSIEQYFNKSEGWLTSPLSEGCFCEKAILLTRIGIINCLRGNLRKSHYNFQAAYLLAKSEKNSMLEAMILSHHLPILALLGEFALAENISDALAGLAETINSVELKARKLIELINFKTFKGDFDQAVASVIEGKKIISENGIFYLYPIMLLSEIICYGFQGDLETAENRFNELTFLSESLGNIFMEGARLNLMGISYYRANRIEEARRFITAALEILESDEGYSRIHLYSARIVDGLINYHSNKKAEAVRILKEVLRYTEEIDHYLYQSEAHLSLGLILKDQGEKGQAQDHLSAAFRIARDKGHYHFLFLNPQDITQACLLVFELEVTGAYDLARELLTNRYAEQAEPELSKLEKHRSPFMRSLGQELLRAIHHHRVSFLDIKTLGGMEIIRGGTPLGEEAWTRLQPKRLLMALLCHSGGKVSKNALMEELWPGEMADKAENNFKVTLMRLRKSLETAIHPTFGSSYIHLHNNLVFLDPEFTRTDADEFLIIVDRGNWKERAGDTRGAVEEYAKAQDIYRGDFLPLETSLPGVDRRRDELKKIFIETLLRLTKLSEKQGSLKKAAGYCRQALEADPLEEEACRSFMRLSLILGNHNEALRVFETLKKNLQKELKSQPDPQTQALYTRIREKSAP